MSKEKVFNLRRIIWPIESHENKKFIPMALMMTCILFNYATVRSIKDGLVVTNIGPEAVSFLKLYVVLPSALVAMLIYTKLCNVMTQRKVFYAVSMFFVTYFVIFRFLLYPYPELVHPSSELIESLVYEYRRSQWLIRIAGNWSYALFYVMAEMWGSMMLTLLFWGFANQVTKTTEAKRFYSMFGLIGNVGLLFVPVSFYFLSKSGSNEPEIVSVMHMVIATSLMVIFLYGWINTNVLADPQLYDSNLPGKSKKKRAKLSLSESFKMIFTSKYLGLIATLVLCYGISMNLVEGIWKSKIRELYPTTESYTAYMGTFQAYQGVVAILFMLIGSNILRRVSWSTAATFTPIMLLCTGIGFFAFIFFDNSVGLYIAALLGTGPLAAAVTLGMIQNVVSKGVKYSLFDSTKEMSYIPLNQEMKTKGKAAVDVIGGRFGKAVGGFIQSTVFFIMPAYSFADAAPLFASVFLIIVLIWIFAVNKLGKEYHAKIADVTTEEL